LVAGRVGITLQLVKTDSWKQSIEFSKSGKCDILSFLNQTPERERWLVFTDPIFTDPNVFITREEHPTLSNETIILPIETSIRERIAKDYPNLTIIPTNSEDERVMMEMVSARKANMTLRSLIVAAYTIKKEGLFNLKIAGQLQRYENRLRVGVLKNEPVLRDILNKGIETIQPTEVGEITNRHVSINVQTVTDWEAVIKVSLVLGVIALISLYYNYRLRRLNEQLVLMSETDPMTRLSNRRKIDQILNMEFERAHRYNHSLSVILIDIDHFKKVNDEYGHLIGDSVIKMIGEILRRSARRYDGVGRWGGEEFIIVCPETTCADAVAFGWRLVHTVSASVFPTGNKLTISAGVASTDSKSVENTLTLLQQADRALYEAKNNGRCQVCS
jgi:diguanylate cyclase (GGDEF)-like protein